MIQKGIAISSVVSGVESTSVTTTPLESMHSLSIENALDIKLMLTALGCFSTSG